MLRGVRAAVRRPAADHLLLVAKYLGWKSAPAGSREMKELEQFLLDRAMEHDSPTLLFNLAREYPDVGEDDPAGRVDPGEDGQLGPGRRDGADVGAGGAPADRAGPLRIWTVLLM